ncbi:hypothetical protein [Dactylosporangium sp. CA-139066]|uniref:hypothetical protein n=1 Tax=Dactylosporangium sp. CA-139066 TaxID=3239930 RepID=UPI003D8E799B
MDETVKLDIRIEISQHDPEYDTELTVDQWNALTDAERSAIYQNAWSALAERDNGGVRVVTEGAEGL